MFCLNSEHLHSIIFRQINRDTPRIPIRTFFSDIGPGPKTRDILENDFVVGFFSPPSPGRMPRDQFGAKPRRHDYAAPLETLPNTQLNDSSWWSTDQTQNIDIDKLSYPRSHGQVARAVKCRARGPGFNPSSFQVLPLCTRDSKKLRTCQSKVIWCQLLPVLPGWDHIRLKKVQYWPKRNQLWLVNEHFSQSNILTLYNVRIILGQGKGAKLLNLWFS